MDSLLIPVLAQQMIHVGEPRGMSTPVMLIPIVALFIPMVVVPAALGARYARQRREMEHAERMRALELGRRMPGERGEATAMATAARIGAGVPVGVMGVAWLASVSSGPAGSDPWIAAGIISTAAVVSGAVLAFRAMGLAAAEAASASARAEKPAFDPDAYDHVGARG